MKPYQLCLTLLLFFIFSCDKEDDTEGNYLRNGSYETEITDVLYIIGTNNHISKGEGFMFLGKGLNHNGIRSCESIYGGSCSILDIDGQGALVILAKSEDEFVVPVDQADPFYVNQRFEERFISYALYSSSDPDADYTYNYIEGTYISKSLGEDRLDINIEGVDSENKIFRLHYSGKITTVILRREVKD